MPSALYACIFEVFLHVQLCLVTVGQSGGFEGYRFQFIEFDAHINFLSASRVSFDRVMQHEMLQLELLNLVLVTELIEQQWGPIYGNNIKPNEHKMK